MTPLEESIAHWERLATGKRLPDEDPGANHCALCTAHYGRNPVRLDPEGPIYDCAGCPVWEVTKRDECNGTPYRDAAVASWSFGLDSPEFRFAAQEELNFLKSLLPIPVEKESE